MIEFNLIEITREAIKDLTKSYVEVETLVCEIKMDGELRRIKFNWIQYMQLYRGNSNLVYVAIPQSGTKRSFGISDNIYWNKVRKTNLYIEKTKVGFELVQKYKVLDGIANIISWEDKMPIFPKYQEAKDTIIPMPIRSYPK